MDGGKARADELAIIDTGIDRGNFRADEIALVSILFSTIGNLLGILAAELVIIQNRENESRVEQQKKKEEKEKRKQEEKLERLEKELRILKSEMARMKNTC